MKMKFVGETDSRGQPLEYYEGVPARDLDEQEVKELKASNPELFKVLTKERKTAAGTRPALYLEVSPPKPAAKRKRPSRAKPKPAPEAKREPEPEPVIAVSSPAVPLHPGAED